MARPNILTKLRHGKILCDAAFRGFAETWNWLVGAFDSLRGDGDVNGGRGFIFVDRRDPDHPVIRFDERKLNAIGNDVGCFAIRDGEIHNPRINIGGKTVTCTDVPDLDDVKGKVLAVEVTDGSTAACWIADELSDVTDKQDEDPSIIELPIYFVDMFGAIAEDYRNAPHAQTFEELPPPEES